MKAIVKYNSKIVDIIQDHQGNIYPRTFRDVNKRTYLESDLEILGDRDEVVKMYVARDESGELRLHFLKPERCYDEDSGCWGSCVGMSTIIPESMFPSLKWIDEPLEVYVNIIPK